MAITTDSYRLRGISCPVVACRIATPRGELPVEVLRPGDPVVTRDHGLQPIARIARRRLDWHELAANPHLCPILIRRGSLGPDLPERDLLVSPNRRLLVARAWSALALDRAEGLVAAKHLIDNRAILQVQSSGTTYLQLLFDRHQTLLCDGLWSESFQPADRTLGGFGNAQRQELGEIFPELAARPDPVPVLPPLHRAGHAGAALAPP